MSISGKLLKKKANEETFVKEFEKCLERLDDDVQVDQKLVDDMRRQGQLIVPEIEGALGNYFEDFEVVAVELPLHEPIGDEADYNFKGFPLRKDFPLTGFNEVRYSEKDKKVIYEPVKLEQNYRNFDFSSPWEGTKYIKEVKEKVKND